jgi:hypothetical protein
MIKSRDLFDEMLSKVMIKQYIFVYLLSLTAENDVARDSSIGNSSGNAIHVCLASNSCWKCM